MAAGAPRRLHPKDAPPREVVDKFLDAVNRGADRTVAAALANISEKAPYRWLHAGLDAMEREEAGEALDDRDRAFADFARRYRETDSGDELEWIGYIRMAAMPREIIHVDKRGDIHKQVVPGDGKVALQFLERRHPSRWVQRIKHETDQNTAAIMGVVEKHVTSDVYLAILEDIACLREAGDGEARGPEGIGPGDSA